MFKSYGAVGKPLVSCARYIRGVGEDRTRKAGELLIPVDDNVHDFSEGAF